MRVMVIVKATAESEAGLLPSTELFEAMGKFNEALVEAGIMTMGDGLKPSSQGKRVAFDGQDRTVIDGPFAETKDAHRRVLAVAGRRHGRGGRLGEALPQPDARPERDRDPAALRDGRLRGGADAGDRRAGGADAPVCGQPLSRRDGQWQTRCFSTVLVVLVAALTWRTRWVSHSPVTGTLRPTPGTPLLRSMS